jgi:hypothetical protein
MLWVDSGPPRLKWCSECGAIKTSSRPGHWTLWQRPRFALVVLDEGCCEGCGAEATTADSEGVPLCRDCAEADFEEVEARER